MPGGDKTGPAGLGPMTGRGRGFCSGTGFGPWPAGRGWFGGGRGRRGSAPGWTSVWSGPPEQDRIALRARIRTLEQELQTMRERLEDLQHSGAGDEDIR
ncbi:MAG: DUF5320 domain-containing protein [Desulfovibrionales bacterium]